MERFQQSILFGVVILAYFHNAKGCSIEGVTNWFAPVTQTILDTHRGIILSRDTSNIAEISNITPGEGLNGGPYVTLELINNNLILSTNNDYQNYEEVETAQMFSLTVNFRCASGSSQILVFMITVQDTNNNDPRFMPTNNYEFTVAPPLPPGFLITDCVNDILVRDIDLTTERINFALEGSSLFEIAYDESSSIPKEFKAILKSTSFIRSISEPITLTISATDVDRTNDPPRTAKATVKILANTEFEFPDDLIFSQTFYLASYNSEQGFVLQNKINLRQGYDGEVKFGFQSEHSQYFQLDIDGNDVSFTAKDIPEELYEERHIFIVVEAEREYTSGATATVILELPYESSEVIESFDKALYNGEIENGSVTHETITITEYSGSEVLLFGEYASIFEVTLLDDKISVFPREAATLPTDISHTAVTLQAGRARSALLLKFILPEPDPEVIEKFDKILYNGQIEDGIVSHETITLSDFTGSNIVLLGEYASSFESSLANGIVTVHALASVNIPPELTHLSLTLQAGSSQSVLLLTVVSGQSEQKEHFDRILYIGQIENGSVTHETITLAEFTGSNIQLIGDYSSLFESSLANGIVTVQVRASANLPPELTHLSLTLQAGSSQSVLLLTVVSESEPEIVEYFDKVLYEGLLENGAVSHDIITLSNFAGSNIVLSGDYASSFESSVSYGVVTVQLLTTANIPNDVTHITLILQAGRARSVLSLKVNSGQSEQNEHFDKILYNGQIENGIVSHETITLAEFTGSNIQLIGDYASSFESSLANGIVTVQARASVNLPPELTHLALTMQAGSSQSVLIITVISDSTTETVESFNEILYAGTFESGLISHDTILLSNYNGTNVLLTGDYDVYFEASLADGAVTVKTKSSPAFPTDLTHTTLTLKAGRAEAVLLLDIKPKDDQPSVIFTSPSYFLWADVNQVGVVGRVRATENNGDTIIYSLNVNDEYLKSRISVNQEGQIILSEVAQKGIYSFSVTATAQNSQASANAPVLLRVDELPECMAGEGLPPLIVLERLEEEPHQNLVILNRTEYEDCHYSLSNIWPEDQSWLYVDENGLHATAIDREDKSIAFMTLSQIQVELRLHCDSDEVPATRRSLTAESLERGTDNYGSNKWILADTIVYDERRSFVNLIVIDINDNSPIFIGKENEPIYIGYPVPELEETVLPRALTEIKATDADIGENAAIIYSSMEDVLAVAPQTGLVHVRNNAELQNNARLTVYATDQNGRGRNGSLDIVVKLLDKQQIAVLTIQNAFLDDENVVMADISKAIGYELKVLRAAVISDSYEDSARRKRATNEPGASLQLYVYGLLENEPVDVTKLTSDISNNNLVTVNLARALSLEEYLENEECADTYTGLLVATIILAVLLLLIILSISLWFFLKWRKTQNYEQFSDRNSLASRDMSDFPKIDSVTKPRLNIEELKRSERRLQEMLDIPIQDVRMEPENDKSSQKEQPTPAPNSTIVNFSTPEMPIVIQSIDKLKDNSEESDDNDEFGEQKQKPRKSVVTFNENVEKIIHLEDGIEETPEAEYEVFKF